MKDYFSEADPFHQGASYVSGTSVTRKGSIDYLLETKQKGDKMRSLLLKLSFVVAIFAQILVFDSRAVFAWFYRKVSNDNKGAAYLWEVRGWKE